MINELVQRLSEGKHEVILEDRNECYEDIKSRIEKGFVHIKFSKTQGTGTELGINIDFTNTNIKGVDFGKKSGILHIEGTANLNYHTVKCVADIDLSNKIGEGFLKLID